MKTKFTLLSILIFFIFRDNSCSSSGWNNVFVHPLAGMVTNQQNIPISSVKIISIYADTITYKQRLDSTFTGNDGFYTMKKGFPIIEMTSGGGGCGEPSYIVDYKMANFFLVFTHKDYDTAIVVFQNGKDVPIVSPFNKIDTIIANSSYFSNPSSDWTYSVPTIFLKAHNP